MKTFFIALLAVLMLVSITSAQTSKAVVFELNGLSNLGVSPVNGGVGFKFHPFDGVALRTSVGGFYKQDDTTLTTGTALTNFNLTGDLLFEPFKTENTVAYFGPEVSVSHTHVKGFDSQNSFTFGGVGGAEFFVFKNVSLGAEYKVNFVKATTSNSWEFAFANNTSNFLLNIYF